MFGPEWWHHHGLKFEYSKPEVSEDGLRVHLQASAASLTLSVVDYPHSGYRVAPCLEYLVAQSWRRQTRELLHGTRGIICWGGVSWLTAMFGVSGPFEENPDVHPELVHFHELYGEHSQARLRKYPVNYRTLDGYKDLGLYPEDFSHQLLFHRYGQFLNIPGPGTGHDGDPNLSVLVTPEIQETVTNFCLKVLELPGSTKQPEKSLV